MDLFGRVSNTRVNPMLVLAQFWNGRCTERWNLWMAWKTDSSSWKIFSNFEQKLRKGEIVLNSVVEKKDRFREKKIISRTFVRFRRFSFSEKFLFKNFTTAISVGQLVGEPMWWNCGKTLNFRLWRKEVFPLFKSGDLWVYHLVPMLQNFFLLRR